MADVVELLSLPSSVLLLVVAENVVKTFILTFTFRLERLALMPLRRFKRIGIFRCSMPVLGFYLFKLQLKMAISGIWLRSTISLFRPKLFI